jgi:hypothetical protein
MIPNIGSGNYTATLLCTATLLNCHVPFYLLLIIIVSIWVLGCAIKQYRMPVRVSELLHLQSGDAILSEARLN